MAAYRDGEAGLGVIAGDAQHECAVRREDQQPARQQRARGRRAITRYQGRFFLPGAGRKAGIPAGQVSGWQLAAMARGRWRGIVGVMAGSSACPGPRWRQRHGPVPSSTTGRTNDQVSYPAGSTQPTPPDAAGAASGRARGDACGMRLARRPIHAPRRAEASRRGAQSRPFHAGARRAAGHHAARAAGHHAARAAGHCTSPYRQPHSAGQRRRPRCRQQWWPQRWRRQHLAPAPRTAQWQARSRSRAEARRARLG